MKAALAILIALHGLLHVMGFARAFDLGAAPLTTPISRGAGVLWLTAAVLWVLSAALLYLLPGRWWIPAAAALLLSQALIVTAWTDARFGTVVNFVLLVPIAAAAMAASPWSFGAEYRRGVAEASANIAPQPILTEADIAHLPAPVQQYLRFTGSVGRPRIESYRLRFRGEMRQSPDDAWMPVDVRQFSRVHPASRRFLLRASRRGIPFEALHVYSGAHAVFRVRIASLFPIVHAAGPEMDQSETVTLFNDMCLLAPATLIDPAIQWRPIDDSSVAATFTNAGHTISAVLTFGASGALVNFESDDRYMTSDGKTYAKYRWSTPVSGYATFDGRRVASGGTADWRLPTGTYSYARFDVVELLYNEEAPNSMEVRR